VQLPPDTDLNSVRRKLACDVYYVHQMNPILDLQILAGTVFHVLHLPVPLSCRLSGVPAGEVIERAFHQHPPLPPSAMPVPQAQPA
jgi:hypothetical protein